MSDNSHTSPQTSETVRTSFLFGGRFTREDFWITRLIAILLIPIFLACIFAINYSNAIGIHVTCSVVLLLYCLFLLWSEVKRLHDIGVSGLLLVPVYAVYSIFAIHSNPFEFNGYDVASFILSLLWLLFLGIKDSQKGTNKYGPSSKYPDAA